MEQQNNNNQEFELELDIREVIFALLQKWYLIALSGFLVAVMTFCVSKFLIPEKFESKTSIYILNQNEEDITYSDLQLGSTLTKDYEVLVKSRTVLEDVIKKLKLNISYDDLEKALLEGKILLAMGNADVPVGQYTQNILAFFGLREEDLAEKGVLTYGSNAREVTTQVLEGAVDCGIIYATDAFSAGLTVVDTAPAEMCGQVIYPAAVVRSSRHQSAAQAFLDYLMSDISDAVFERVGFTPIA